MSDAPAKQPSVLDRFLGIFTEVKAGEGLSAVLLLANVFLLLTSYYVIKPVRDGLIITMPGGPEYKSYMGGAIAIALLFAVPAYASFAKKLPRNRLVVGATLFFMANLVLFAIGTQLPGSNRWLPLVFYLWVGIFNMMVVAQFWAFANDIYTEEQGERLFPLIGIGASAGAAIGGALAKFLPKQPSSTLAGGCEAVTEQVGYFDTAGMLLVSGGLLGLCALLTQVVHRRETRAAGARALEAGAKDRPAELEAAKSKEKHDERPGGAFTLVFRYRYLVLLAAFSLLFTFANTNGEYMISRVVKDYVFGQVGRCEFPTEEAKDAFVSGMFTSWYGDFYLYVNVAGVVLQSFAVSRVVKWGGLRLAFFVFPIMALLGATSIAILPVLAVVRWAKIAENSTDYSFNNTARNMLWLPTTPAMKYQAKQAIDTFFVRIGDVSSALLVFTVAQVLKVEDIRIFAAINVALVAIILVVCVSILRAQKGLKEMKERGELPE